MGVHASDPGEGRNGTASQEPSAHAHTNGANGPEGVASLGDLPVPLDKVLVLSDEAGQVRGGERGVYAA